MKYIRTKDGRILEYRTDSILEATNDYFQINYDKDIKIADTIRELIMKGDLVFYKDAYCGLNATENPSIAYNDIDKCSQYFEKEITKIFIEDTNGNFIKVAEENEKHELELL